MTVSLPLLALAAALQSPLPAVLAQAAETPQVLRGPKRARTDAKPAAEPQKPCGSCAVDADRKRDLNAREARLRAREEELSAREKSHEDAARKKKQDEADAEAEAAKRRRALEKHAREVQEEFRNAADALGGF
jgi:hypothetical protein